MTAEQDVFVVGAGGFGSEALQYARDAAERGWPYRVAGFLDDVVAVGSLVDGVEVVGTSSDSAYLATNVVIAIGEARVRAAIAHKVRAAGGTLVTLVHPTAYVAPSATLEAGCLICPFALVGVRAVVGANVAMNVYSSVGHDSNVGAHTVLSPYAAVLGRVAVGPQTFLGTHSTIAPGVSVDGYSKISAGALVTRNAPAGSLLVGNPAKGRVMFDVGADI